MGGLGRGRMAGQRACVSPGRIIMTEDGGTENWLAAHLLLLPLPGWEQLCVLRRDSLHFLPAAGLKSERGRRSACEQ